MRGMIAAALSPVSLRGKYDYGLLKSYVDWLLAAKVDAIFALGSTGAFPVLTMAERKQFAEGFARAINGAVPLILHVGSTSEEEAMALARQAGELGVSGFASVPPYFYHFNNECVSGYFERLAAINPDIPFYIYNIPSFTHSDITPHQLKKLTEKIPNLSGIKDTTQDFPRFVDYCDMFGPDLGIYMGSDAMCLAAMEMGGKGAVSATAAHHPEVMVDLFSAINTSDKPRARKMQFLAARLRLLLQKLPFMSTRIEIVRLRGIVDCGFKRPFLPLDSEQKKLLVKELESLQEEFSCKLI